VALSGLYLVLVAIAAYGAGGYVAGRMRGRLSAGAPDEIEFRDGVHGAAVWALATLLTALIVFGGAQALTRVAAPSSGPAGPSTSVAGENIIAYDIDRLFRGCARTPTLNTPAPRRRAFCSPPPATAACCPRIAPSSFAWSLPAPGWASRRRSGEWMT
jgi:hypothetical protein